MEDNLEIKYSFTFTSGETRKFTVSLDRTDLSLCRPEVIAPPSWTVLHHHQCSICPLDNRHQYCPIALNMIELVEAFQSHLSHEQVKVVVTTTERTYAKSTTLQESLSSLKGIIMVSSGCPVMERLKPMVRFHLPFATLEETSFRMVSMYLVAQYLRRRHGVDEDGSLKGLEEMYADVVEINKGFAHRLLEASTKDANVNALVNLDCFAEMIPLAAEDMLQDMESYFAAFLG